jgi:hypothetical protein
VSSSFIIIIMWEEENILEHLSSQTRLHPRLRRIKSHYHDSYYSSCSLLLQIPKALQVND